MPSVIVRRTFCTPCGCKDLTRKTRTKANPSAMLRISLHNRQGRVLSENNMTFQLPAGIDLENCRFNINAAVRIHVVVQRPSSSTNQPNSNAGRRSATRPRGAGSRPFPPSRVPLAQRRLGNRHRMLHLNNLDRPGHHSIEQSEPGPSLTPT